MNEKLLQWINRLTRSWKYNRKSYRNPLISISGAFVLYFILTRLNFSSLDSMNERFTATLCDSETFLRSFFRCLK